MNLNILFPSGSKEPVLISPVYRVKKTRATITFTDIVNNIVIVTVAITVIVTISFTVIVTINVVVIITVTVTVIITVIVTVIVTISVLVTVSITVITTVSLLLSLNFMLLHIWKTILVRAKECEYSYHMYTNLWSFR